MRTTAVRPLLLALSLGLLGSAALSAGGSRSAVPAHPDDKTIVHVLNRIGFGPTAEDVERIRQSGLARYIDRQLQPDTVSDDGLTARLAGFATLQKSSAELAQTYFLPAMMERRRKASAQEATGMKDPEAEATRAIRTPEERAAMMQQREVLSELSQQKILRAAYSERQLEEVMVDFWFNHFNVFAGKGPTRLYLTSYERDTIRPHALGTFRGLLGATAESPAMLFYLDNWQSSTPDAPVAGRRRPSVRRPSDAAPPKARPRGLNENYARELMELHTLGVDGGYTQQDVENVARAFTGWTITTPRQGGSFRYEPRTHDDGAKVVLGHRLPAGGGRKDGERVLDILASHPATSRHVATKLARRFVADEPPAALVDRAAARFRETDGDIREVVRTILTSPEFFAPAAYRAKVKTPFEFVASAVRATAFDTRNAAPLIKALRDLGMPLYFCQPPTGYGDRAEAWVNTGALLNRMNFAVAITQGGIRGRRPDGSPSPAVHQSVRDSLTHNVLADDVSEATRATVGRATEASQAVALLLGSPEFQRK
jgi:uncharacterized protein (DUF1800 family)